MNLAALMLVYNQTPVQFDLTVKAVESVLSQNVPIDLFIIDNGSTENRTRSYLESLPITLEHHASNQSPVLLTNRWMKEIFEARGYENMLGVPNDVRIPSNLCSEMLRFPRGVVAASMTSEEAAPCASAVAVNTCTPMAVVLIRKWVYSAMLAKDGYFFDPNIFLYASDCDFALRMAACGIVGVQLDIQYHHTPSSSWRLAPPEYARRACLQADRDRAYFERKWGFSVSDPRYSTTAADINFRGEPKEGT